MHDMPERHRQKWRALTKRLGAVMGIRHFPIAAVLALFVLQFASAANANTIDATYTVSGTPGSYTYDFTVSNNLSAPSFVVQVAANFISSPTATNSPAGWQLRFQDSSGVSWFTAPPPLPLGAGATIQQGNSLSGFELTDSTLLTSLEFMSYYYSTYPGLAGLQEYVGTANLTANLASTPLPAAFPLFATGLGGLGLLGWRRKRKNTAAVAA
jgi:hypothetical protein